MSFTLCTSGAILWKAGYGADWTGVCANSYAILTDFADKAEARLSGYMNRDLVSLYSTISTNFKPLISDTVAVLAAIDVANYNPLNYPTSLIFQTTLDLLTDDLNRNLKVLQDDNLKSTMGI